MTASNTARLAGALYLLSGIPGVFSYLYVPSRFVVPTDAGETVSRITASLGTYRLGIVSDVFSQVVLIALAWTLFELLQDVDRKHARLMLVFASVGAAVECVNVLHLAAPVVLIGHRAALSALPQTQLQALVLASLDLRAEGVLLAQVFWGLWLLPFGILVVRSRFFPPLLGWLLVAGCFGYVTASAVGVIAPEHGVLGQVGQAVGGIGEAAIVLWLLIKAVPAVATAGAPS